MQGEENYDPSLDQYYLQPAEGEQSSLDILHSSSSQSKIIQQILNLNVKKRKQDSKKYQKLSREHFQKQKRLQILTKQYSDRQKMKCSFRPKTNYSSQKKRSVQAFVDQQQNFVKKKQERLRQLRMAKQQLLDKQNINLYESSIHKKKNKSQQIVFDRLTAAKKPTIQQKAQLTYQPVINSVSKNLKREGKIEDILYEDAMRRALNLKFQSKQSQIVRTKPIANSTKLAAEKFIKEFNQVIFQLDIRSDDELDYLKFNQILTRLHFISRPSDLNRQFSEERALVHEFYQFLQSNQAISAANICQFCLCIKGLFCQDDVIRKQSQVSQTQKSSQTLSQFGFFSDGVWSLQFNEIKTIQKKYQVLARNQLTSKKYIQKAQPADQYKRKPKIDSRSNALAERHRKKMLMRSQIMLQMNLLSKINIPESKQINHADLLILQKRMSEVNLDFKRKFKEDNQTFIAKNSSSASLEHCQHLYTLSKNRRREDRSFVDIQFEQQQAQCTFQPDTKKPTLQVDNLWITNTQNQVRRMVKGRQLKQNKEKMIQRGYHTDKKSCYESREPLIQLQVQLKRGKVEKVSIYQGEDPYEVASRMGRRHNLQEHLVTKLWEAISRELRANLQSIQQVIQQTNRSQI